MTPELIGRLAHAPSLQRFALFGGAVVLLALGFYLRLDGMAASLWIDEFGTFWVVERDFTTTLFRSWEFQGQSPLYYVLAWISTHAIGESEAALRAPSLVLGCLFVVALYVCGRILMGTRAGCYAAVLGWLSIPSIRASVEARPYALALLGVAMAIAGFQWAVRSGRPAARVLWILGGAVVAWSHYVQYPLIVGLFVAYALLPDLRVKYTPRRFLADGFLQIGLVALCIPQVLALLARRGGLSWIDESNYTVFLGLLLPLLPAIGLGEALGRRDIDRVGSALRRSLWICLLFHVASLEAAAFAGMNLLNVRYFLSILVPAVLLAAMALTRVRAVEAAAALLAFATISGGNVIATKRMTGTFSGVGHDDWRGAVAELSRRLSSSQDPLVLFRSGFVEEDVPPIGSPPAATLAPLRSPGHEAFGWPVRSLTFRWNSPSRKEYFDRIISTEVRGSSRFFALSGRWGPEPLSYTDEFVRWVEDNWPGRFQPLRTSFGGVELLEFRLKER